MLNHRLCIRLAGSLALAALIVTTPAAHAEPGPTPDSYARGLALYRLRYDVDARKEIEAFLGGSPSQVWERRARFLRGVLERRTGDPARSVETLRALLHEVGVTYDEHVRLELVRSLHAAGKPADGLAELQELQRRTPGFEDERVALEQARLLTLAGRTDDAIDAWAAVLKIKSKALPKDEARRELAILYGKAGDAAKAEEQWRRLVVRMPQSLFTEEALTHVPLDTLTAKERFDRAELLFKKREYLLAKVAYESLLGERAYRDKSHLMLGSLLSERLRQSYPESRAHFEAASKSKDKDVAGPAMYKLGIVHGKLGDHGKAVKVLRAYRKKFKGDRSWSEAGFEIGRQLMDGGQYRAASKELAAWLAADRSVKDRSMYQWFVGWSLYRGGHWADAIAEFKRLAGSRNTLVGDKALFWTGKAQDAMGKRKAAVATMKKLIGRFAFTYYSWLAERQLDAWGVDAGVPERDFSATPAWPADPWGAVAPAGKRSISALNRVRDLVEIGAIERARDVWKDLSGGVRADLGAAKMAALEDALDPVLERFRDRRSGRAGKASKAKSSYPTKDSVGDWRDYFPKAYASLAMVAADKEGLPEGLLYSHMLQESRYNPRAVSNAPAFGVLQLLQRTARRICSEIGIDYDPHDLFDPGTNVRLAAWYLGALKRRFKDQTPLAVASYNGGPKLLSFHMDTHPGLDLETLIEDLATHQSRNYCRKVLEHFHRYLAIYASPAERKAQMEALFPAVLDYVYEQEPSY